MENILFLRKNLFTKQIINSTPQHLIVAEDGGVLYGFKRISENEVSTGILTP